MTRCLVGGIDCLNNELNVLDDVKQWVDRTWRIPGGVEVKELDADTFLFIFPSKELVKRKIGKYSLNGYSLLLDAWHSWGCCNRRGWSQQSTWIRVVGLPVFLWDPSIFESIGDYCGGYLETSMETMKQTHLKWAKLKIKGNGQNFPALVTVRVGDTSYNCPIWVESRPWVDWIPHHRLPAADSRPTERRKKAARVEASGVSSAAGRQTDTTFTKPQKLKRRNNASGLEQRKVQWIKVSNKDTTHSSSISNSNSLEERLPSFNRFEPLITSSSTLDGDTGKDCTPEFKGPNNLMVVKDKAIMNSSVFEDDEIRVSGSPIPTIESFRSP